MPYHLVVVHPFGKNKKGDVITDPAMVETILASHHERRVVKIGALAPTSAPPAAAQKPSQTAAQ